MRSIARPIVVLVCFWIALVAWALGSPSESSPDDEFHVANIYCLADSATCRSDDAEWPNGQIAWPANPADRGPEYAHLEEIYPDLWPLPQPRAVPCFAFTAGPADCLNQQDPSLNTPGTPDQLGYYPPVYYKFMSLFTLDTIRKSVVLWRLINVSLTIVVVWISVALSLPRHRRAIVIAWLVSSVPFGVFLVASINPSAWAIIGAISLVGPLTALLTREPAPPRAFWARVTFVVVCAVMAMGARTEGILHVGLAAAVAILLGVGRVRRPRSWSPVLLTLIVVLAGSGVLLQSQADKASSLLGRVIAVPESVVIWDQFFTWVTVLNGAVAGPLGWLDVAMPASVATLAAAAFWGALFIGLSSMYGRKMAALGVVIMSLVAVPAFFGILAASAGGGLQARYFLPYVYLLGFTAQVGAQGSLQPDWRVAQRWALVVALAVANSLALLAMTVHFVSGPVPGANNPRAFAAVPVPEWWWDAWLSPFGNWVLGTITFAIGAGLAMRWSPSTKAGPAPATPVTPDLAE